MSQALVTASMDTSRLESVIPDLVSFGRRTVKEQCVTSMGMILQDGQNWTPFVGIGRMDAELDVTTREHEARTGIISTGRIDKTLTYGELIVLERTNPNSKFNKATGGRWALQKPDFSGPTRVPGYKVGASGTLFYAWLAASDRAFLIRDASCTGSIA